MRRLECSTAPGGVGAACCRLFVSCFSIGFPVQKLETFPQRRSHNLHIQSGRHVEFVCRDRDIVVLTCIAFLPELHIHISRYLE
jgi:hypothetical protein